MEKDICNKVTGKDLDEFTEQVLGLEDLTNEEKEQQRSFVKLVSGMTVGMLGMCGMGLELDPLENQDDLPKGKIYYAD